MRPAAAGTPERAGPAAMAADGSNDAPALTRGGAQEGAMAMDPACLMEVEPARAAAPSAYRGETYHVCAVGGTEAFDREPGKYLARP